MAHPPLVELDSLAPNAIDGRHIRAVTFQKVRMTYIEDVLARHPLAPGSPVLVIGSGRGLLARALAGRGFSVTAADPSQRATDAALAAVDQPTPPVRYLTATADELAAAGDTYALVYVADTLEVSEDLHEVTSAIGALVQSRGLVIYDTVNRTGIAKLVYLGAFQKFPPTRIMPPDRYTSARLRPPSAVTAALASEGFRDQEIGGFKPVSGCALVAATLARRRGKIDDEEIARRVDFVLAPSSPPKVTYFGHARKA
ncbi:class I SAM-dependent methyltransferase [Streptodolium elevatio]